VKSIALVLALLAAAQVTLKGSRVLSTLFAVDLGAGPFETGLLFALHGLFPALLSVTVGRLADRIDNRAMFYWGLAAYGATVVLPFFWPSLSMLYLQAALGGFTSMIYVLAAQNLIGLMSTPATRTRNYSYYALTDSVSSIVGPLLVGISIDTLRHPPTYLWLSLYTLVAASIAYVVLRRVPPAHAAQRTATRGSMLDLLRLPAMRNALATNGILMAGIDLFGLYLPVYARGLGFSATTIGTLIAAYAAAGIVVRIALPYLTDRLGDRRMVVAALVVSAAGFVVLPLLTQAPLLAVADFVLGLGLGCGQPLSMALAFNASPPGRTAEGIAMRLSVSYGAHIVIPPAFGGVGAALGLGPIFWTCAGLLAMGALLNRRRRSAVSPASSGGG
jgi:MFS family permease